MKRLYVVSGISLFCLALIFGFCLWLGENAQRQIREELTLLRSLPEPERFERICSDPETYDTTLQTCEKIALQMKKAGRSLAFSLNKTSVGEAQRAAQALLGSVAGKEGASYGESLAALLLALESLRESEAFSLRAFL